MRRSGDEGECVCVCDGGEEGVKVVVVMVFGCKKNVAGEVSGAEKNREIWPCTVYWIDRNERDAGSSITQNGLLHCPHSQYIYMICI